MEPSTSERIAELAARIAAELGANAEQVELMRFAGRLRNVGMAAIPDEIVLKQSGLLTDSERRVLERHAEIGSRMISDPDSVPECVTVVRLTGHPYPGGDPRGAEGDAGHTPIGGDSSPGLEAIGDTLESIADMVLHHHERWDGKGYPDGLSGEAIPIGARIIAVADAFGDRVYRQGQTLQAALTEIRANACTEFCPRVVAALDRVASET